MSPIPTTPTPNTPGTPLSPLPCIATTPTKTGVPDTVKASPGSVGHYFFSCLHTHVSSVQFDIDCSLVYCFYTFLLSQCSSCVPSLIAPAGNHLTHKSGCSTSFTASHISTHGSDSESPGSRLPPSGAGCFCSDWSGLFSRKSASHIGTSDPSPDQDASLSGSQRHFTGHQNNS